MRLFDIDEVIKVAENTFPQEDVRKIMWVLCHTPTAYDIEKVVAELEEISYDMEICEEQFDMNSPYFMDVEYKMVKLEEAISIVRKGGVE